jgi:succinate dehydrogenase / fumarate reductase membrane anchor subunit
MSAVRTPSQQVRGLGASHSGTGHFWRQRITAVALVPLSLWFAYVAIGLAGTTEVSALIFLAHSWNAILLAAFVVIALYHAALGLQVVIDDYVHAPGSKIFLFLLVRFAVIATGSTCIFALLRIAAQ